MADPVSAEPTPQELIIEAGARELYARPTCPHIVMVTITQPARCNECTVRMVAPAVLRAAADLIAARFPTATWPEDSQHPEARVAAGVRLACQHMRLEANRIDAAGRAVLEEHR